MSDNTDPRLSNLLELWDRLEEDSGQANSLGITVIVDGHTFSGMLIAPRVWAKALGNYLRIAPDNPQLRALAVFFDEITDAYERADGSKEAREHLHLANVVPGLPGNAPQTSLLMRVRASAVSAWTIGTMGQVPPFQMPEPQVAPIPQAAGTSPASAEPIRLDPGPLSPGEIA